MRRPRGKSAQQRAREGSCDCAGHLTGGKLHDGRQEGREGDRTGSCGQAPQQKHAEQRRRVGKLRAARHAGEDRATEGASLRKQKCLRSCRVRLGEDLHLAAAGRRLPPAEGGASVVQSVSRRWGIGSTVPVRSPLSVPGACCPAPSGEVTPGLPADPPGDNCPACLEPVLRTAWAKTARAFGLAAVMSTMQRVLLKCAPI